MLIKDISNSELSALVAEMRRLEVSSLSHYGFSISLAQEKKEQIVLEPSRFEDESKKDLCECGHSAAEHNEAGFCLNGCDEEICHKQEEL